MPDLEPAQPSTKNSHPLTREQLELLTSKSDVRGFWLVGCQFALTLAIFAGMAVYPHPLTIFIGLVLLGGRQLGFFIITHEAGHRSLFRTQAFNVFVSKWLTAPMDFSNGQSYMREHLHHHQAVGSQEDPDLANYQDYPISRERLKRKLKRDLTDRTGWRNFSFKMRQLGNLSGQTAEDRSALVRGVVWHVVLLALLAAFGAPWLFLIWIGAQIFAYPAIVRIRQIAEHAAVPNLSGDDARENTRTTVAHPIVRLLLCPHGVNYHVEHHLLASVPIYHLRDMHKMLRAVGYFDDAPPSRGYLAV